MKRTMLTINAVLHGDDGKELNSITLNVNPTGRYSDRIIERAIRGLCSTVAHRLWLKPRRLYPKFRTPHLTGSMVIAIIWVAFLLCSVFVYPHFEAKRFNRMTGSSATYWDAFFTQLRVQEQYRAD